jgi:hypothetical protein
MTIVINGTIKRGLGAASTTVKLQLEQLARVYPPIARVHAGTINVQLERPLRVNNPSFTSEPIRWHPHALERFSFLEIEFECPSGAPRREAWIYIPHNSPHRPNLFIAEVLAEKIEGVQPDMACRILINHPHHQSEVIIV